MRLPLAGLLAALLMALLVVPASTQTPGRDPAPDQRVAAMEVDFMMGMIPHHREAIAMARMALTKATRPELREMAQMEIDTQGAEIARMTVFLRDWYGMEAPTQAGMTMETMRMMDMPMMRGMMPDMAARMRALEAKSGADFDIEFMSAMTQHHAQAIMMSSMVLMMGHHEDLIDLAAQITEEQTREIKMMDEWLEAWYEVVRPLR